MEAAASVLYVNARQVTEITPMPKTKALTQMSQYKCCELDLKRIEGSNWIPSAVWR